MILTDNVPCLTFLMFLRVFYEQEEMGYENVNVLNQTIINYLGCLHFHFHKQWKNGVCLYNLKWVFYVEFDLVWAKNANANGISLNAT